MFKKLSLLPLFLSSSLLFAQASGEEVQAAEGGNFSQTLIMIGIAILFFYFILWRPEQKRRKALETQRSSMKKGDKVTAMGIIGTIVKISAESPTVILKMYDGAKIEILKAAITEVHPATDDDSSKLDKEEAVEKKD